LMIRGNLKAIHFFGKCLGSGAVFNMHAKKTHTPQATRGVGTGGAWVAISQPKAMPMPTWAIYPYGPPYPCRFLTGHLVIMHALAESIGTGVRCTMMPLH